MIIYRHLLVSKNEHGLIAYPDLLLHARESRLCRSKVFSKHSSKALQAGTNSSLLEVCRGIYQEALFILYSENTFLFDGPVKIDYFRASGLNVLQSKLSQYRGACRPN